MRGLRAPYLENSKADRGLLWTSLRRLWAVISLAIVLLGLVSAIITIWPRVTATTASVDDSNAYAESFTVTNNGFVPLENFTIGIGFCLIETARHDIGFFHNCDNPQNIPRILVFDPSWQSPSLGRDETFTVTLTDELNQPTEKYKLSHPRVIDGFKMISGLKGANAVVVTTFQPWIFPCFAWIRVPVCEEKFRFIAEELPNGKVTWHSVPLDWRPIPKDD
jgi:hypothetical protein